MKRKGQSFLEYSLLIGCIAITLFAMQTYLKRGIQGVVKSTSDDLGSPVLAAVGREAQVEGARSKGRYEQIQPTTITHNQDILTNEWARGERGFQINEDLRVTEGEFTVTQKIKTYSDYNSRSSKDAAIPANPGK